MTKGMHIDWYIFDECVLRDMDMSERNLNGAHFIKVDARGTFFIKSQLQEADFSGADLRNTYFVEDRKSTRLNSSHANTSYAVFCLKKKKRLPQLRSAGDPCERPVSPVSRAQSHLPVPRPATCDCRSRSCSGCLVYGY